MRNDEIKTHNMIVFSKDSHKDTYEIEKVFKFLIIRNSVCYVTLLQEEPGYHSQYIDQDID
jgi:hypothetical protein